MITTPATDLKSWNWSIRRITKSNHVNLNNKAMLKSDNPFDKEPAEAEAVAEAQGSRLMALLISLNHTTALVSSSSCNNAYNKS